MRSRPRSPFRSPTAIRLAGALAALVLVAAPPADAQRRNAPAADVDVAAKPDDPRLARFKQEVAREVESMRTLTQQMVDMIFSFGELGFQEVETSRYLTGILREHGFRVESGISGIPTAWMATWGNGKPVIALGSDIDGIPQSSQKPGVSYRDPLVEGAPGHGEGHNSGQAVIVTAAIAVKKVMERERMPGTIKIWPGVAEELVATKAYFVRDGYFRDVDASIFTHVGSNLSTSFGDESGTGLVSVEYSFLGNTAHSAGSPWRGRSALDAVELMNIGWNFRREHLALNHRSHYVIRDGGDQPNVVPRTASVWYYFRHVDYPGIKELWAIGDSIAAGAAMMTGTELQPTRVLGAAWPRHFNKPIAEAMHRNIQQVGLPTWSAEDQLLARAVQREQGSEPRGLDTTLSRLGQPTPPSQNRGGGSDDIGDISWAVPTVTLRFPSNIPGLPGHHWSSAIAMATPIAHKGATAGAKVTAMTMLDLLMTPALVDSAKAYFTDVQTKDIKYTPLVRPQDKPAVDMNVQIMARYRPEMRKYYYDPSKHRTYLEQLGITYPTVRPEDRR